MELIQIFDSVNNELLKVIVPSGVAERCRRDVEFATDLYEQINQSMEKTNEKSSSFQSRDHVYTECVDETAEEKLDSDGWFRRDLFRFIKILQKFRSQLKNPSTRDKTWLNISKELASLGIMKSIEECSKKWSILLRTHKFVGDESNPRWKYFREFSSVLNGHCDSSDSHTTEDDGITFIDKLTETGKLKLPAERDFWSKLETLKFLSTYQKHKYDRKKSNEKQFWSVISSELAKVNVFKSWEKCCIKWKNLYRTYKKNLTRNLMTARRFMFFEEMDEVLNNVVATETEEDLSLEVLDFLNQDESLKLIEAYEKHKHLFEQSSSDKDVWSLISDELACEGIHKDAEKCETTWNKLRMAYTTHGTARAVKTKFLFANEMESILKTVKQPVASKDKMEAILKTEKQPVASKHKMEDEESENEDITIEPETFEKDNDSWSSLETSTLIETYGEHRKYFSEDDREPTAWEQISADLSLKNIHRTPENCERKWKSLLELYMLNKHNPDQINFEFYNEIDTIFDNEQVKVSFKEDDKKRHKKNCGCFERKMMEKGRRHQERMGMMKRKLDLEERKLLAFEKYLNYLKTEKE